MKFEASRVVQTVEQLGDARFTGPGGLAQPADFIAEGFHGFQWQTDRRELRGSRFGELAFGRTAVIGFATLITIAVFCWLTPGQFTLAHVRRHGPLSDSVTLGMSEVGPLSVWGLELASLGASSLDRRTSHHELLRGGTRGVPGASGGSLAGITAGSSLHADDCSLPCCSLFIESEGSSRLAVPRCGRPRSGCDLVQSHSGIPAVPEQFGVLGGFVRGRAIGTGVLAGAGAKLAGFKVGASRDDLRGRGRAKTRSCRGSRGLALLKREWQDKPTLLVIVHGPGIGEEIVIAARRNRPLAAGAANDLWIPHRTTTTNSFSALTLLWPFQNSFKDYVALFGVGCLGDKETKLDGGALDRTAQLCTEISLRWARQQRQKPAPPAPEEDRTASRSFQNPG